jgi:hypothetical protein
MAAGHPDRKHRSPQPSRSPQANRRSRRAAATHDTAHVSHRSNRPNGPTLVLDLEREPTDLTQPSHHGLDLPRTGSSTKTRSAARAMATPPATRSVNPTWPPARHHCSRRTEAKSVTLLCPCLQIQRCRALRRNQRPPPRRPAELHLDSKTHTRTRQHTHTREKRLPAATVSRATCAGGVLRRRRGERRKRKGELEER